MQYQGYIVVGAGLAGCLVAWRLEQAGQEVTLIGNTRRPCASEAAGGIINPVTGRWMTKSWMFDECAQCATSTYRELEECFGVRLYTPMPLIRYCKNEADVKRIQRRMRNPRYTTVLGDYSPSGTSTTTAFHDTHGSFCVQQAACVDLPQLLHTLRTHFAQRGKFRNIDFEHNDLKQEGSCWNYHDLKAAGVIFCEGAGLQVNPWFDWLPLNPVKGETVLLECKQLRLPRSLFCQNKWLLPLDAHCFRVGSTYDEKDITQTPTAGGKHALLEFARSFIAVPHTLQVKSQTAGLRPCSRDLRPFVGSHPAYPGLHIINGLGSKGTLLAPEMIQQFLAHLFQAKPLESAIDCTRYFR